MKELSLACKKNSQEEAVFRWTDGKVTLGYRHRAVATAPDDPAPIALSTAQLAALKRFLAEGAVHQALILSQTQRLLTACLRHSAGFSIAFTRYDGRHPDGETRWVLLDTQARRSILALPAGTYDAILAPNNAEEGQ